MDRYVLIRQIGRHQIKLAHITDLVFAHHVAFLLNDHEQDLSESEGEDYKPRYFIETDNKPGVLVAARKMLKDLHDEEIVERLIRIQELLENKREDNGSAKDAAEKQG